MARRVGFPPAFCGLDHQRVYAPGNLAIPHEWQGRGRWRGGPLHTFVDDYRQEFFWRRPEEGALIARAAGIVTAPDFTAYLDDPQQWRTYQAWRSATVAKYWQSFGVAVLPVVSFRSGCAYHVERDSVWAIRAPRPENRQQWEEEVTKWAEEAEPLALVVFGRRWECFLPVPLVWRSLASKVTAAQKEV